MEQRAKCGDCQYWEKTYETATLTFFRLQSQFQIASLSGDVKASEQLACELDLAAIRRLELREVSRTHRHRHVCAEVPM